MKDNIQFTIEELFERNDFIYFHTSFEISAWLPLLSYLLELSEQYRSDDMYVRGSCLLPFMEMEKWKNELNDERTAPLWFIYPYRKALATISELTPPELLQFLSTAFNSTPNIDIYIPTASQNAFQEVLKNVLAVLSELKEYYRTVRRNFTIYDDRPYPQALNYLVEDIVPESIVKIAIEIGPYDTVQVNLLIKNALSPELDAVQARSSRQRALVAKLLMGSKDSTLRLSLDSRSFDLFKTVDSIDLSYLYSEQHISARQAYVALMGIATSLRFNFIHPLENDTESMRGLVRVAQEIVPLVKSNISWDSLGLYVQQFVHMYLHDPLEALSVFIKLGKAVFPNINENHIQSMIVTLKEKYYGKHMEVGIPVVNDVFIDDLVIQLYGADSITDLFNLYPALNTSKIRAWMESLLRTMIGEDENDTFEVTDWIFKDKRLILFLYLAFLPVAIETLEIATSSSPQPSQSDQTAS